MASLSVSRRTSLVAGPLGTLPRFGETTCAQDAVVATSSINVHNLSMRSAPPLERPTLSELGLASTSLFPCWILILILCIVFSFSSNSGIHLIFIRRRLSSHAFIVPSQRLGVCSGYNSAGHVQQESAVGERSVLYSPQHPCAAGKGI